MTSLPASSQIAFVPVMIVVLIAGLGISAALDSALWVAKASGLGWMIDFANSHAWLVVGFTVAWAIVLILGLSHPEAPGISTIMKML